MPEAASDGAGLRRGEDGGCAAAGAGLPVASAARDHARTGTPRLGRAAAAYPRGQARGYGRRMLSSTSPKRGVNPLPDWPSQSGLIDAAEQVDGFPRVVDPSIGGFDVEVRLVAGGISARLVVNDSHEHGCSPEFGEQFAGPFSGPAAVVNLVDEEYNLVGHLGCVGVAGLL